jgi:hypothetical protein
VALAGRVRLATAAGELVLSDGEWVLVPSRPC